MTTSRRALTVFLLALALGLGLARLRQRFADPRLVITFFDVGQGDSALLRFPFGSTWLIDAGGGFGKWDMGSRELLPELARRGILGLDVALLSHPDQDHGYGLRGILDALTVGELWVRAPHGETEASRPLLLELEAEARAHGTAVRSLRTPTVLEKDGVRLEILPIGVRDRASNDHALVVRVGFGGCQVLFTGDIEAPAEAALLRRLASGVTLLKVAHHGSDTSSSAEFLARVTPRWAVVSVGEANSYGHPHPAAVSRLRAWGARIFRTDFHGFVEFSFSVTGHVQCRSAHGDCGEASCLAH